MYFEHSGLLLQLGRFVPKLDVNQINLRPCALYRRAKAIDDLARLIILDAGKPTVQYIRHDRPRCGEFACLPLWTGETGDFIVVTGIAKEDFKETTSIRCNGSDFYVSLSRRFVKLIMESFFVSGDVSLEFLLMGSLIIQWILKTIAEEC